MSQVVVIKSEICHEIYISKTRLGNSIQHIIIKISTWKTIHNQNYFIFSINKIIKNRHYRSNRKCVIIKLLIKYKSSNMASVYKEQSQAP